MTNEAAQTSAAQAGIIADLKNRLHIAESALAKIGALATKASARGQRMSLKAFQALNDHQRMQFVQNGGRLED